MIAFTQTELYEAVQQYVENQDALLSEAKAAVVEWRYANDEMFGLFPLFDEIEFRGSDQWYPAKRAWFTDKPTDLLFEHGIDAQGKTRLIQCGLVTKLFRYFDSMVDEMLFRDREASPRALKRHLFEQGRIAGFYEYCVEPHQYSYEAFQFTDDKLVKSVEKSWFIKNDEWVEASWTTTFVYEYDSEGLLRVSRDMGEDFARLGGNRVVYVRPTSGPFAPLMRMIRHIRDITRRSSGGGP